MTKVRITDDLDDTAIGEVRERVIAYNLAATGLPAGRSLGCIVRDPHGQLIAGLDGFSWGGYAKIEWLWVREDHRGHGLGRELVRAAEAEAADRGCSVVRVDSHTFQAPSFYEKLGYERIGFAGDTPLGHGEAFFLKRLPTASAEPRSAGEVMRAMVAAFDSGDVGDLDAFVHPDFLDHQGLSHERPITGIEGFRRVVETARSAYAELSVTVVDLIETADRAAARLAWTGVRSSGEAVQRDTLEIVRVERGRAVEHWGGRS